MKETSINFTTGKCDPFLSHIHKRVTIVWVSSHFGLMNLLPSLFSLYFYVIYLLVFSPQMCFTLLNAEKYEEDWGQMAHEQGTQSLGKKPAKYKKTFTRISIRLLGATKAMTSKTEF